MNANDVLKYGHGTVMRAIEGLDAAEWETGGVCGVWSVKHIIAHLASYELVLAEVLSAFQQHAGQPSVSPGSSSTPMLNAFVREQFNDTQVALRQNQSPAEILAEYSSAYEQVAALAAQLSDAAFRQAGTLPWYGLEYALDDFIVYAFYGHKREHCAQIAVFRDRLAS
jgi:uncharacterized damage-inducible protein DinB